MGMSVLYLCMKPNKVLSLSDEKTRATTVLNRERIHVRRVSVPPDLLATAPAAPLAPIDAPLAEIEVFVLTSAFLSRIGETRIGLHYHPPRDAHNYHRITTKSRSTPSRELGKANAWRAPDVGRSNAWLASTDCFTWRTNPHYPELRFFRGEIPC